MDIFIPSINLAFELNGVFHYKPIYGEEKLKKIQKKDMDKIQACKLYGIDLMEINVSGMKHFKEKDANIILQIITSKLLQALSQQQ